MTRRTTKTVRTVTEDLPPPDSELFMEDPETQPEPYPRPDAAPTAVILEENQDPLLKFFDELDRSNAYYIEVEYLPDYEKDGRTGIGRGAARSISVCKIRNLEIEDLLTHEYREAIQQRAIDQNGRYYGGTFRLELRQHGAANGVRKRWTETLAALPNDPNAPTPPTPLNITMPPPQFFKNDQPAGPDLLSQVENVVTLYERLDTVFGKRLQNEQSAHPPQTQAVLSASTDKPPTLEEKIWETVLVEGLKDPKERPQMIAAILGARERSDNPFIDSLGDGLKECLRTIAPLLPIVISRWASNGAPPPPPTSMNGHPQINQSVPSGVPNEPQSTATAQAPTPVDRKEQAYQRVIYRMLEDCLENIAIEPSMFLIDDLCQRYEDLKPLIETLMTVAPEQVFDMAGAIIDARYIPKLQQMKATPQCVQWISNLQAEVINASKQEA